MPPAVRQNAPETYGLDGNTVVALTCIVLGTVAAVAVTLLVMHVRAARRAAARPRKKIKTPAPRELESFDAPAAVVDDACPICLEALKDDRVSVGPCKSHYAHTPCLQAWFAKDSSCPVCRTGFDSAPSEAPAEQAAPGVPQVGTAVDAPSDTVIDVGGPESAAPPPAADRVPVDAPVLPPFHAAQRLAIPVA